MSSRLTTTAKVSAAQDGFHLEASPARGWEQITSTAPSRVCVSPRFEEKSEHTVHSGSFLLGMGCSHGGCRDVHISRVVKRRIPGCAGHRV